MSEDNTVDTARRTMLRGAAAAGAAGLAFAATAARAQDGTAQDGTATSPTGQRFADKIVLITGATSGIGRATVIEFAKEGATVVFNGRRAELGQQVQSEIEGMGGRASYIESDVRDREQVRSFVDGVVEEHGRIDVAFNNAGIAIPPSPVEQVDPEQYDDIIATNVNGVFWSMHHELRHMKEAGTGVIVNTSSVFGPRAADNQVPYGATRSAVNAMTEAAAKEAGPAGVRIVAVAPGAVPDTDLFRFLGRPWNDEERAYMASLAGLKRVGTPLDLARMVLALASDDAGFVHGSVVRVDGQFLQA